jgi:hypothetical protein
MLKTSLSDFPPELITRPNWSDLLLALGFSILGGVFGALVLFQTGVLYFYQSYMPELVYSACGSGFVHPAVVPKDLSDFLSLRTATFDCSLLDRSLAMEPRGVFLQGHFYLASAVAALWRLSSIDYRSLWPLVSLLVGTYASGSFVLLRLFFGRLAAAVGAAVLTLSPVMLSMTIYLRDYGKAPFFIWGIVLLVLSVRARSLHATLLCAVVAGAIVGLGSGFRSDVTIMLPIGLLFLAVGVRLWWHRGVACASFAAAALLLASPMLTSGGAAGGSGFLLMEGLSEPFRAYLSLGVVPYDFGPRYSDELVMSSIAAELRPSDPGWDAREGAAFQSLTQSVKRSSGYVGQWLPSFAGDLATQGIKSAGWIVGFPALVAPQRLGIDPGGPVRAGPRAAQFISPLYNLLGQSWLPVICLTGLIAFFWRVDSASPREALALLLMLGALLAYPVVQFSIRHVFHLEFIWVAALLSLIHLLFHRAARRSVSIRFAASVAVIGITIFAVRTGLTAYQDRSLAQLFGSLLSQPRELVTDHSSGTAGDGRAIFAVPMPDQYRSLVGGRFDSMTSNMGTFGLQADVRAAADRLLLTLGGPNCPQEKLTLSVRYAKRAEVWQPFDHDLTVERQDAGGTTTVLIPAFYRPTQYLSGIEVPAAQAGCITKIERVNGTTVLPVILTAILSPGWQQQPLHRSLGGFAVNGMNLR